MTKAELQKFHDRFAQLVSDVVAYDATVGWCITEDSYVTLLNMVLTAARETNLSSDELRPT